jgi:hypothetical protein
MNPEPTPHPKLEIASPHNSSVSLPAIKQNTKITNVWGLLGIVVTTIVAPLAVKVYSSHQDDVAAEVAEKQAAMKQEMIDLKAADQEAHQRLEQHIGKVEDAQDRHHNELMQALKKR